MSPYPNPQDSMELRRAHIEAMAKAIVHDAERYGLVLTIETRPLKPLAMGHHVMEVSVREARQLAPTIKGDWE